jgi:hypothetical protein
MRRLIAVTLMLVISLFFTGCTTYYYQEGNTFEECENDYHECYAEYEKYEDPDLVGKRGPDNYESVFMDDCMEQRGYKIVSADKLPLRVRRLHPDWFLKWQRGLAGTIDE